jgi:hypothetical protein
MILIYFYEFPIVLVRYSLFYPVGSCTSLMHYDSVQYPIENFSHCTKHIVACRRVARQRPRNMKLYNGC